MAIRLQELPALLLWRHDHSLLIGSTAELEGSQASRTRSRVMLDSNRSALLLAARRLLYGNTQSMQALLLHVMLAQSKIAVCVKLGAMCDALRAAMQKLSQLRPDQLRNHASVVEQAYCLSKP